MSRDVMTIGAAESCHDAVERMHRARIRHLPVVDGAGSLVGIVTDRDLRHRLFRPDILRTGNTRPVATLLKGLAVKDLMSSPVVTARPEDELAAAAALMLEHKVGSLPVVEHGRVVGVVTETDLLRHIVHADACCDAVADIVVSYP
jgi:acetoin utilization protein AcuB